MMGGAVILAIATSVFKVHVMPQLRDLGIGSLEDLAKLEQLQTGIGPLSESFQEDVRSILSRGFNRQILTLCISGAAELPALLLIWKRQQILLPKKT
jgi:hypothetical protein